MKNGPMRTMERMHHNALRAVTLHEAQKTGMPPPDPEPDWLHGALLQRLCALLAERFPHYVAAPHSASADLAIQLRSLVAGLYPDRETPLFLAVELLSTNSRKQFANVVAKAQQVYQAWGIPHVWILDAHQRQCWHSDNGFRTPVAWLDAPPLRLGRDELFATLDTLGPP